MAVDAAILESLTAADGPTLRFYRWSAPTLSLGYFQLIGDRALHPDSREIDVVRRTTGGGAIIHDREWTYSLAVPMNRRDPGAAAWLYQAVHLAIISSLQTLGITVRHYEATTTAPNSSQPSREPFLCFQRRTSEDLVLAGYKVLGSAQRRGRTGLLQHGSLLLAAATAAPQLPGLVELANYEPNAINSPGGDRIVRGIGGELASALNVSWVRGGLTDQEYDVAVRERADRFSTVDWTKRR